MRQAIFERLGDKNKYTEFTVCASYLEIYNEELTDLLKELPPTPKGGGGFANKKASEKEAKMDVVEDRGAPGKPGRGMVVNGLSEHTVTSTSDVLKLIRRAVERRQVQETNMNKTSSRSHCVFTLAVTSKSPTSEGDGMVRHDGTDFDARRSVCDAGEK